MNELAILHYPESKYCFAMEKNLIEIRIRIDRKDNPEIYFVYGDKYDFCREQIEVKMERRYEDRLYAYYVVRLQLNNPRLVYVFKIIDDDKVTYYSEDGLTETYDFKLNFYNSFQYSYINKCDVIETVPWMKDAIFYQIFVDRFARGSKDKDESYINLKWGELPNPKSFAGGDIKGIVDHLEYLKNLGINAIYLTPIFKSVSNHKYDISDYYKIDEMFGNKSDLKELIEKAHSMGMRIILDAVFNHVSENLPQFHDVLKNKNKSKYYSWFVITNDDPLDYECFASCKYMPKFDTSNPEVQKYLIDVATYWIKEFDIDGWRLDVSDEVSHLFWRKFRQEVKKAKSDAVLIGENWHDANIYLRGDQYDSIMNYAFTKACLDFYAFDKFDASEMSDQLVSILMRNMTTVNKMLLNLLDSHDTLRFYTEVKKDKNKLMSALALLYMFEGTPCIYYGTENAMEGGYDPDSRRTMDWSLAHTYTELKQEIQSLSYLKKIISDSDIKIYSKDNLLCVERYAKDGIYLLVINGSKENIKFEADDIILFNNYENQTLLENSFVIVKK